MGEQLLCGRRVLVVEDEMLVLMAIEDMLADLGCTSVMIAGTVDDALDLIATNVIDIATLDVNLNGTRSDPIADALVGHGIPFAFSTGCGELGIGEGFGGHPVLNKPYGARQLAGVLTRLLALRDKPPDAI